MTQKEPVSKKEYYNIPCRMIKELDYGLQKQVEDIIDETKCEDYNNGCCKGDYYSSSVATTVSCDPKNMRCDFYVNKLEEQLSRKTAECEKYEQALEEVYGIIVGLLVMKDVKHLSKEINEILNIISKAKDNNNE